MVNFQETPELRMTLDTLREEVRTPILWCASAVGYVAFFWRLLAATNDAETTPLAGWVGLMLLISGAFVCWRLQSKKPVLASQALIWGMMGAAIGTILAVPFNGIQDLLILPIIFGMAVLDQKAFTLVSLVGSGLSLLLGYVGAVQEYIMLGGSSAKVPYLAILGSPNVLFPFVMVVLVSVAAWLSIRTLYTAAAWAIGGYERAREKEQLALDQEVELRRANKRLDDAHHRLERTNHLLQLTAARAEEARYLKQQFAQSISHELRTPLNLIVSFTELMTQSPDRYGNRLPATYQRDMNIVYRNAHHLQTLVNDVLDLARIEAMHMSVLPERTDPALLIQEVANTIRALVEKNGLALRVEIGPALPNVYIDSTRIRQVLFNLINNAIRFTERGGITLRVWRRESEIIFAVSDTGIGIAEKDIPRLFEEFSQLDGSTRRRHGGTGLGLYISRSFVELHGGHIWVESQVGQGCTFSFSLPVHRIAFGASQVEEIDDSVPVKVPPTVEEDTLLVISSNFPAVGLVARALRGFHAEIVPSLDQAERAIEHLLPEAILIDTADVSLTPAEIQRVAREWRDSGIPIICCALPDVGHWRRLNVEGYLLKPVSSQSLYDALRPLGETIDRILVVDDDQDFARLVDRILSSPVRRYHVSSANTAKQALDLLQYRRPDLILLDLVLPDMEGEALIEQIRCNPSCNPNGKNIPILVVSGRDELFQLQPIMGGITLTTSTGLMPDEVVRLIQAISGLKKPDRSALADVI